MSRIVIAEDDPLIGRLVAYILAAAGYDPVNVGDGTVALQAVRQAPTALVITDLEMPGIDGYALIQALRRHGSPTESVPILVLSAHAGRNHVVGAIKAGANAFVSKHDLDVDSLLGKVNDLIPPELRPMPPAPAPCAEPAEAARSFGSSLGEGSQPALRPADDEAPAAGSSPPGASDAQQPAPESDPAHDEPGETAPTPQSETDDDAPDPSTPDEGPPDESETGDEDTTADHAPTAEAEQPARPESIYPLPDGEEVAELLTSLLGKEVEADDAPKAFIPGPKTKFVSATYTTEQGELAALIIADLRAAAGCAAALAMMPAESAAASVRTGRLNDEQFECWGEVLNIAANMVNSEATPPLRLSESFQPGDPLPDAVRLLLERPASRTDFVLHVPDFPKGKLSLLAG